MQGKWGDGWVAAASATTAVRSSCSSRCCFRCCWPWRRSCSTSGTCTCTRRTFRRSLTRARSPARRSSSAARFSSATPTAANDAIRATALEYAGDTTGARHVQPAGPEAGRRARRPQQRAFLGRDRPGRRRPRLHARHGRKPDRGDPCSTRDRSTSRRPTTTRRSSGNHPALPGHEEQGASRSRPGRRAVGHAARGRCPRSIPRQWSPSSSTRAAAPSSGHSDSRRRTTDLPFLEWGTSAPGDPTACRVDLQTENTGVVILVSKIEHHALGAAGR